MITRKRRESRLSRILSELPLEEGNTWRARLDKLEAECGCKTGAIFMILGLLGWIAYRLASADVQTWRFNVLWGAVVLFGSALIGKLLGLFVREIQLYLVLRRLEHISQGEPNVH